MFLVRRSMNIATSFPWSLFYFGFNFPRYNQPDGGGGAKHSFFLLFFSLFSGPQASGVAHNVVVLRKCFVLAITCLNAMKWFCICSLLIPPKRFDIFSPITGGRSEGLGVV